MRNKSFKNSNLSGLATLLMFGVFAVCILSVLLTGAGAYKRLTARDQESFSARTCSQYVTTKVRQASSPEEVYVESFGGCDCLVLGEVINGASYETRVYCYDGWICELFTGQGGDFLPEDGERVVQAQEMAVSMEGSLLSFSITDDAGYKSDFDLKVRGLEGRP